jgi:hypothetical protein
MTEEENIALTSNGIWLSDGVEITHEATLKLFARSLNRDKTGWFLKIGRETKRITVQDTAYFVIRIDGNYSTGFTLLLNDGAKEHLNPATLNYQPGRLVTRVKGGAHEAKFLHAPYFELLQSLQEDPAGYFIVIQGLTVRLSRK